MIAGTRARSTATSGRSRRTSASRHGAAPHPTRSASLPGDHSNETFDTPDARLTKGSTGVSTSPKGPAMYDLCECRARLPVISPLDCSDQSLGCRQTARTTTTSSFMRFVGRTFCSASSSSDLFPAGVRFALDRRCSRGSTVLRSSRRWSCAPSSLSSTARR